MKTFLTFVAVAITTATTALAQEWQRVPYPEFKPYTSSAYCRSDAQGNIWVDGSTFINGKNLYSTARFDITTEKWTEYSQSVGNLPKDSTIQTLITRRNGTLVAVTSTALYIQNSGSWNKVFLPDIGSHTAPILTIDVKDMIEDRDNNIWVVRNLRFGGINVSHVSRFNGTEWTSWCTDIPFYSYQGVNTNQFRSYGNYNSIKQAPNGDIWMMGRNGFALNSDSAGKYEMGGIAYWNGKEWMFWMKQFGVNPPLLSDNGTNFAIDENNRLIIAQAEISNNPYVSGGIIMFDNGAFKFYRQDNGSIPPDTALGLSGTKVGSIIINDRFIAMDVAIRGTSLYFNTQYHGILEFDGTRWRSIANKLNGLIPSEGFGGGFSIAVDKNGDLWATIISGDVVRLRKNTTSVSAIESDVPFAIAPNPAQQSIRVFLPDEGNSNGNRFTALSVVNALGVTMLTVQEPTSDVIDVSSLANGAYFLRATTTGGKTITKPFVIER